MAAAQILPLSRSSPDEDLRRTRRRYMVDSAMGTTLAEGVSPGPDVITLSERYIAGEITLQELGVAIRAMSGL